MQSHLTGYLCTRSGVDFSAGGFTATPVERIKAVLLLVPENSVAFNEALQILKDLESENGVLENAMDRLLWIEEAVTHQLLPGIASKAEDASVLLTEEIKPVSWLIENIWTSASRGFIAGHPGVGKTWLALDMMLSVATGKPFLGLYNVAKPMNVLLVEEESSREALKRRLQLLTLGHGLTSSDIHGKFFTLTRQMIKLHKHTDELRTLIDKRHIGLVVFDSFRRIHDAKESSSDEMALVLQKLSEIQYESDVSLILIHHLKKSGMESKSSSIWEQLRGSSDLWAWRDCIIGMEATDDPFAAACQFQFRDAEASKPLLITRRGTETSLILLGEKQEEWAEFKEQVEAIKTLLRTSFEPISANKIREKLKYRKAVILEVLRYLSSKNEVSKVGSGPTSGWQLSIGSPVSNVDGGNQ